MEFYGNFSGGLLGGFFWKEFFAYIGFDLFVKIFGFCQDFVSIKKEGQEFRSLEVRCKLIALKNSFHASFIVEIGACGQALLRDTLQHTHTKCKQ